MGIAVVGRGIVLRLGESRSSAQGYRNERKGAMITAVLEELDCKEE